MEKTKEYTETTYDGIKDPQQSSGLVSTSPFWAELATHIASNTGKQFVSESFIYLNTKVEFTLATAFLPKEINAVFEIADEEGAIKIEAKSSFLIFIKEVKAVSFENKFGVLINQRFFDPLEKFTYEDDGTQIEKEVTEFLVRKVYDLQTVVTNTSGTSLELQLLMDVPEGAIPLRSHEYTQIVNATIGPYSTSSFERSFYFPREGKYALYPANACRGNSIVARAGALPEIQVRLEKTVKNLESFNDVMKSGSQEEILQYIQNRNIFDSKIFTSSSIYWMLRDKSFFEKVVALFRKRSFYERTVWSFGFLHDDATCISEYLEESSQNGLQAYPLPLFEYFPYYSSRTHKFLNESKSTIRNVNLKQTYHKFLLTCAFEGETNGRALLAFTYYLLLQDRIDEASIVFSRVSQASRSLHQIQSDYIECFLDMYQGYPNFTQARKISALYTDYPVTAWKKLFKEIHDTLKEYDSPKEPESVAEKSKEQFSTTVVNEGTQLRVSVPAGTRVELQFFSINLELYFSELPFAEVSSFSSVRPSKSIVFESGASREERVQREQVTDLRDFIVDVYEFHTGLPAKKVFSEMWSNPEVKARVSETQGTTQIFHKGQKQAGVYCKVYSNGNQGAKFYRDGYTDITGTFKYALADLDGIREFAILTVTDHGGVVSKAKPPSQAGHYAQ